VAVHTLRSRHILHNRGDKHCHNTTLEAISNGRFGHALIRQEASLSFFTEQQLLITFVFVYGLGFFGRLGFGCSGVFVDGMPTFVCSGLRPIIAGTVGADSTLHYPAFLPPGRIVAESI
jgi:hypothetical protein